ncbi:MAG: YSC84-related protein [Paracoccaceae bacterium]
MKNIDSSRFTRRGVILTLGAGLTLTAACGNGVGSSGPSIIDARVDAALAEMYRQYPNTVELSNEANGLLVMPLVTEAGFIYGGAYGQGALRIDGTTVDYYSTTKATAGLQIGAQQYAHVLFFMTEDALQEFRRSSGWAAGAGVKYVVSDEGDGINADTTTSRSPILAAVFGQEGLLVGATLEGSKYTRIIP